MTQRLKYYRPGSYRAGKTRPAEVVHVTFNNTKYVMYLKYRTTPKGLSSHLLLRDQSDNQYYNLLANQGR